jgi:N-acetylglutamate synthase
MGPQIAEMTAEDYDDVAGLWRNTEGVGLSEGDTRAEITGYLARNPGLCLVARHGNRIVAAVLCGHDGRRGCLYHLAIAAPHRRQGLGRALVGSCLEKLASLGIRKCNTFLFSDNEPGEAFWKKIGWKERADLKVLQKPTPNGPLGIELT